MLITCFKVSSQVAFNSQRIKTKDESVDVDSVFDSLDSLRRERNGTPRQLNHVDNGHQTQSSGIIQVSGFKFLAKIKNLISLCTSICLLKSHIVALEDGDVQTGHNHKHGSSNPIDGGVDVNRRIDNEIVRELVDCGGSDLGFCDMNSRYPG